MFKLNKIHENQLGIILVLLAGACFAFLGIFGKYFYNLGFTTGEILTFRFLLATVILFFYFLAQLLLKRKNFFFITRRQLVLSALLGIMGYALFSTLLFISFKYLSVSLAVMLLFTFPIFVFLGSVYFYKEPVTLLKLLSLVLAGLGLALLFSVQVEMENITGVAYALVAAIFYAIYILVSAKFQKDINPLTSSFYVICASALTLMVVNELRFEKIINLELEPLLMFMGLAMIGTVLPLTLFLAGLQKISSTKASILGTIEPILASVYAFLIFDEKITLMQLLGMGFIILADILIVKGH